MVNGNKSKAGEQRRARLPGVFLMRARVSTEAKTVILESKYSHSKRQLVPLIKKNETGGTYGNYPESPGQD
ncbi:hypothetical protein [Lacticaseibacillus baoqingensis]|uniref:hypothetical protein n=1 Tax=Lacticaseibacillus baoqingensis TaxID=2486013 RepID=UPI0013DE04EF|nr:hypothetical protein [Lacticaseibacillus baoqingensis]